jgi:predicted ATP-grasp superfamily ATP-dependent carboligase
MRSRYARRKLVFPGGVLEAGTALSNFLETHLAEGSVLIPTSDAAVQWMAAQRGRLESCFRFCIPSDKVLELLLDKSRQVETVRSFGIPVPNTSDLMRPVAEITASLRLPVIIKPTTPQAVRDLGMKNRIVHTPDQLREFVGARHPLLPSLLAQEIIPGPDSNQWVCNCTFDLRSRLAQAFTFQRLSLYPPHRGQTSYARSRPNAEVVALVEKIGRLLEYTGPAMMEFKYDERDGRYKYFETNPRLGQCNFFDTSCGVNNVYGAYRLALGQDLPDPGPRQRNDVMFLNLLFDVRGRLSDGQGILATGLLYLRHLRLPHVGQWRYWRDPIPSIANSYRCFHSGVTGMLTRRERGRSQAGVQQRTESLPGSTP